MSLAPALQASSVVASTLAAAARAFDVVLLDRCAGVSRVESMTRITLIALITPNNSNHPNNPNDPNNHGPGRVESTRTEEFNTCVVCMRERVERRGDEERRTATCVVCMRERESARERESVEMRENFKRATPTLVERAT